MIGDWMGSIYAAGGRRYDYNLFLDHDGRYERTVRLDSGDEYRDAGRWEHDEVEHTLHINPDTPDDSFPMGNRWAVLSVTTCEDSNVLLVLRERVLASRNLPILFYRVHGNKRGYGTGWENQLKS